MTQKTRWVVASLTLVGVLLGGLAGYFLPDLMVSLGFIGGLFLNALRLLILPLIVAALVAGVASLGRWRRTGSALGAGLSYFIVTTLVAVGLGLLLVTLIGPGIGADQTAAFSSTETAHLRNSSAGEIAGRFIPSNPLRAVMSGNYFGVILLSLLFGMGLAAFGPRQRTVTDFFRGVRDIMVRLVQLLLYAAPVGLFFIVGRSVAETTLSGHDGLGLTGLSNYLLVILGALLIHGVIVLPLILKFFTGRSPLKFVSDFMPAFGTAFGTGSALATLPVTWECVVDKSRVDNRAGALMLPLGATINLDGAAIYTVVVTMFVAQAFGIDLSVLQVLGVVGAVLLASLGTAGVPGASLLMSVMVFDMLGFPSVAYAGLGMVAAADWLVQRGQTTLSVFSGAVGAAFVEQRIRSAGARRPSRSDKATRGKRDDQPRRKDRGRDQRSGEGRPSRGDRGRRTSDQRSERGGRRNGRHKDDRRPDSGRSRPGRQNDRQRHSPFAMKSDDRSEFDPDAAGRPSEETDAREKTSRFRPEHRERVARTDRSGRPSGRKSGGAERNRQRSPRHNGSAQRESRKPRHQTEKDETERVSNDQQDIAELTPKTIERERERVSAHLASLKQNEQKKTDESESTKEPGESSAQAPSERTGDGLPHIDYYAGESRSEDDATKTGSQDDDDDRNDVRQLAAVIADNDQDESDDNGAETGGQSFGRKRVRRGDKFKGSGEKDPDSKDSNSDKSTDVDEFKVEAQSFGRAKKKRTR